MQLIPEFKTNFRKFWSVRLGIVAAAFSGCEAFLPLFEHAVRPGIFALISFVFGIAALVARGVAQKALDGDK
jgi:hypothetical protein